MAQLHRWLEQRNLEHHRAAEIDEQIWRSLGAEHAVLVIDMSGFTRTTKELGICHFLAMHRKAMELATPRVRETGGHPLKQDADNLIALFPCTADAIRAAVLIQKDAASYNRTVEYERQIGICIGISYGRILKTDVDVFGDAVNTAYKLGEDIADPWDILVSDDSYAELGQGQNEFEFREREEAVTGKVPLGFRRLAFSI